MNLEYRYQFMKKVTRAIENLYCFNVGGMYNEKQ